uniref:Vav 3 guanine nucleotide exchange factor b n=1 Tax=Takifugu rubripes TaxID=31033 RepID=H2U1H8_TAKRU
MEYWRQCAMWLISCNVLPKNHRVVADRAQVFDLAQTLRDGVLLCQLLNNLRPHTINLKEINLRPQMSQFLCLKNIRTFLTSCNVAFAMKKIDLFDAFDLFDVRDFGKVTALAFTSLSVFVLPRPFPTEESLKDEDIYNNLEDLIEYVRGPLRGPVSSADGFAGYLSLQTQAELDVRTCCLSEIKQTEEKYTETLESIEKYFLNPLKKFISAAEIDRVFINIPDLVKVHRSLFLDVQDSILNKNASNLYQIFISYKERLLVYGIYCSQVEVAIVVLDQICKEKEDVRLKLEECSKRANNGKFTLRDLLVVPMQRVLKYHLLLQELVKHTHDATDKSNLKVALDAMRDLAQFINEVKRDNETLREINQYQRSIENLNQPLITYGRPRGDGEVRMVSSVDKRKQDRHIFLFDVAAIVCKRRGDNYEMKDVLDLHCFKVTNNPTSDREGKKWCYGFYVTHQQGHTGFELFFKTRELKKKWLDRFEMAISDIRPEKANHNSHQFKMHTFEKITSCSFCHLLLRGIFNQGYLCLKCGLETHKECLGQLGVCGRTGEMDARRSRSSSFLSFSSPGLPRLVVIRAYSGIPSPHCGPPLSIHEGDVIELLLADLHSSWWQGKILATSKIGFFPSDAVRPCPCVSSFLVLSRFAGPMERCQAELELSDRDNSTFLVRHRSKECTEYALSIKFNDKVKHIKILTKDGCFYIAESRLFKTVADLVEYYKQYSLKEGFRGLDTTLQVPYREPSEENRSITKAGSVFSPRVMAVAVARYDFASRDTQELSLLKGDIIRVYTKLPDGWWKGEVDGRVGWFPSTYVEED